MVRFLAIASAIALGLSTVVAEGLLEDRAINGRCTGSGGRAGVCISTSSCSSGGGVSISGACPNDPADIKCCTKASCGSGGSCKWTSDCTGSTQSGLCPGPSNFMCCLGTGSGGGFPTPSIPAVGACKASAVNGARAVVNAFPGKVREIGCVRACSCPGSSDHCCGLAIDYMCSSAAGVRTDAGRPMAEWMMNNRGSLKLKYVIWGQRIWNPSQDAVKPWSSWRVMEDRGSVTQNHWDHVHASFNA